MVSIAQYQGQPGTATTRIVLWDTARWKRKRMLMDEATCYNAIVAYTRDNRRLVAATEGFPSDGNVYAWDLPTGNKKILAEGEDASYAAVLIPPGRWFVAGGKEWIAYLLDLRTGQVTAGLPHPAAVTAMAAAPGGKILVTGDNNGTVRFWSMPPPSAPPNGSSGARARAPRWR